MANKHETMYDLTQSAQNNISSFDYQPPQVDCLPRVGSLFNNDKSKLCTNYLVGELALINLVGFD